MRNHARRSAGTPAPPRKGAREEEARALAAEHLVERRWMVLSRMMEREMARDLKAAFDLTAAEWRVLTLVCTMGSISAIDVSVVFERDSAEVSRAVYRLLAVGLVARDGGGRRKRRIDIIPTDAGRALFARARVRGASYFASLMTELSAEEQKRLDHALESVARRVSAWRET